MHSHYGIQATSHAKVQLSVHERIGDLHKRASGMAPAVEESAANNGCTDWSRRKHRGMGPRQRMAWDMVAEALGWNAISDKPAMLAAAEQCERDGQPYYVGYAHSKPAEFTTALATETDAFTFGVWGHDQPLEVLPADDARELADTNALIDEISERHGLSTEPAEELTSANAQPCPSMHPGFPGLTCNLADGHSADHYALGYTWPNLRPVHEAMAEAQPTGLTAQLVLTCCGTEVNYPQAGGETACTVCHTTFTATAACPDDLVSCENCCPQCHVSLTLMDALSVPVPSEAETLAVLLTSDMPDPGGKHRKTFRGTAEMSAADWTSVVRPSVPVHYAHRYTRG